MSPTLRESCGVFGVYAPGEDVARITFYGLYALQHRGQESAGIASANERRLYLRTGMGLVSQVFDEEDLSYLPGHLAIGHTRYSTTGSSLAANAQPIIIEGPAGQIALGHNGNVVNADVLRSSVPGLDGSGVKIGVISVGLSSLSGNTESSCHCGVGPGRRCPGGSGGHYWRRSRSGLSRAWYSAAARATRRPGTPWSRRSC